MVLEIPGQLLGQSDVRETPTSTATASSTIIAPIGTILPWLKSYTNTPQTLPTGWVECDGSVVSDADSVYDGQNLPDLNGGEFIRGSTTSGGTGGSDTMAHTHSVTSNVDVGNHTALTVNAHSNHTALALNTENAHTHSIPNADGVTLGGVQYRVNSVATGTGSAHTHTFSQNINAHSAHVFGQNISNHSVTNNAVTSAAASNTENRPPYYNVVWIIRVK